MGQPHYYDVYLRTQRGTVKRRVTTKRRSVKDASTMAKQAVERVIRESVEVIDCVPLKASVSKKAESQGRGRKQMLVSKIKLVQTRRPKARASVKLSRKGKPYKVVRETMTAYESPTCKLRDRALKPEFGVCQSEPCIKRGTCRHEGLNIKRKAFLIYLISSAPPGRGKRRRQAPSWSWVIEAEIKTRAQAAQHAVQFLSERGHKDIRVLDSFTAKQADKAGYSRKPQAYFEAITDDGRKVMHFRAIK